MFGGSEDTPNEIGGGIGGPVQMPNPGINDPFDGIGGGIGGPVKMPNPGQPIYDGGIDGKQKLPYKPGVDYLA